jgi:D-alanyl-lipoteichoic acid acyltransferase DltB (MBOAT superfamily)
MCSVFFFFSSFVLSMSEYDDDDEYIFLVSSLFVLSIIDRSFIYIYHPYCLFVSRLLFLVAGNKNKKDLFSEYFAF